MTQWGPDNPHPLSTLKTELVWEGKYDQYGNRHAVDIAGCSMPMQKIETIDEPRREAIANGEQALFEKEIRTKRTDDPSTSSGQGFRNMLIWGDNKLVMASLLKDFKGKIGVIQRRDKPDPDTPLVSAEYLGKAPDIGAYELGDKHYWIPGRQDARASTPVPPTAQPPSSPTPT